MRVFVPARFSSGLTTMLIVSALAVATTMINLAVAAATPTPPTPSPPSLPAVVGAESPGLGDHGDGGYDNGATNHPPNRSLLRYQCTNNNDSCEYWAGLTPSECVVNPSYMLSNCQLACGCDATYPPTATPNDECTNQSSHCEMWAERGECTINPGYMLWACAKACNTCTDRPTNNPTTSPTDAPTVSPSESPSGSFFPSSEPSYGPTKSPKPSSSPSSSPSASPSHKPTTGSPTEFTCPDDKKICTSSSYVQYGCTEYSPAGPTGWAFRTPDKQLQSLNIDQCNDECSKNGYDFFGFECPMIENVHCQCYTADFVGGKAVEDVDCKKRVGSDGDKHCTGTDMFEGISLGGADVGSIYKVKKVYDFPYVYRDPDNNCEFFPCPTNSPTSSPSMNPSRFVLPPVSPSSEGREVETRPPRQCNDVKLNSQIGTTNYPTNAVEITGHNTTSKPYEVTVNLFQKWSDQTIDSMFAYFQKSTFDKKCYEKQNVAKGGFSTITLSCGFLTNLAILEICVADNIEKNVLTLTDDAKVPECCHSTLPAGTPVSCYVIEVSCEPCETRNPPNTATYPPIGVVTLPPTVTTVAPTSKPTKSPSRSPTLAPVQEPLVSDSPSDAPTGSQSESPSGSFFPSSEPSYGPTKSPKPSSSPSSFPTKKPTKKPTGMPSSTPSSEPTISPSASPVAAPSSSPSQEGAGTIRVCVNLIDKITEKVAVGAKVRCYDKDPDADDLMGIGTTTADGCVSITYDTSINWDYGSESYNPDIVCTVNKPGFVEAVPTPKDEHNKGTFADMGTVTLYRDRRLDFGWNNGCSPRTGSPADFGSDFLSSMTRFTDQCNMHDKCYADCQILQVYNGDVEKAKAFCDGEMLMGMQGWCNANRGNFDFEGFATGRVLCLQRAQFMITALDPDYYLTAEKCEDTENGSFKNVYDPLPTCHGDGIRCGYEGMYDSFDNMENCNDCCSTDKAKDEGTLWSDVYCDCLSDQTSCGSSGNSEGQPEKCNECCGDVRRIDGTFGDSYSCMDPNYKIPDQVQCGYEGTMSDDTDRCHYCDTPHEAKHQGIVWDDVYCGCLPDDTKCGTGQGAVPEECRTDCCGGISTRVDGTFDDGHYCFDGQLLPDGMHCGHDGTESDDMERCNFCESKSVVKDEGIVWDDLYCGCFEKDHQCGSNVNEFLQGQPGECDDCCGGGGFVRIDDGITYNDYYCTGDDICVPDGTKCGSDGTTSDDYRQCDRCCNGGRYSQNKNDHRIAKFEGTFTDDLWCGCMGRGTRCGSSGFNGGGTSQCSCCPGLRTVGRRPNWWSSTNYFCE